MPNNHQTELSISVMNIILQGTPGIEKDKEYISELFERCSSFVKNETETIPMEKSDYNYD